MLTDADTYPAYIFLPLSDTRVWDADGTNQRAHLGKVGSMCSDLVGNDSSLHVIPVGQTQMLLRCHIAQQSRPFTRNKKHLSASAFMSHTGTHMPLHQGNTHMVLVCPSLSTRISRPKQSSVL